MAEMEQSMERVLMSPALQGLPEWVSRFGMNGYFVDWNKGMNTRDSGIYFVVSSQPVESPEKLDIKRLTLYTNNTSDICTRFQVYPVLCETTDDPMKASVFTAEVLDYCKMIRRYQEMFEELGDGAKVPDFVYGEELRNYIKIYGLARYDTDIDHMSADICEMIADATCGIRKYTARIKKAQEKYSRNPILRFFHIKSKACWDYEYVRNPRLKWSRNPLIRFYRWLRYRNSQRIPYYVLLEHAGRDDMIEHTTLYTKYRDPSNGKYYSGNFQLFAKRMAEKYPEILYNVKRAPTYKSRYVPTVPGQENPFRTDPCYEARVEISYRKEDAKYINGILCYLNRTSDYRNRLTKWQLHPTKTVDEMLQKYGKDGIEIVYVEGVTDMGANVGLMVEQMNIDYAIDDGTTFACDNDGCLPYVFSKKDAHLAYEYMNDAIEDFSTRLGELPEEHTVRGVDEPIPEKEPCNGFAYIRQQAEIHSFLENSQKINQHEACIGGEVLE